jgi:hypothetical protein
VSCAVVRMFPFGVLHIAEVKFEGIFKQGTLVARPDIVDPDHRAGGELLRLTRDGSIDATTRSKPRFSSRLLRHRHPSTQPTISSAIKHSHDEYAKEMHREDHQPNFHASRTNLGTSRAFDPEGCRPCYSQPSTTERCWSERQGETRNLQGSQSFTYRFFEDTSRTLHASYLARSSQHFSQVLNSPCC